jgi:anti-sigma factor RsiW
MKHPSDATLALHAGDDLGTLARWRIERHLAGCDRCRDEVAAYRAARQIAPDLAETPELAWNRLAAEMKANIRLGLAAGECVRADSAPSSPLTLPGFRPAVAVASVIAVMATGILLERPVPRHEIAMQEGVVVQQTAEGIQVREGGRAFGLLHSNVRDLRDVTYTVGAQGSMRARYVDPDTGYVTINNVYAE